jgi:hypothetical protein
VGIAQGRAFVPLLWAPKGGPTKGEEGPPKGGPEAQPRTNINFTYPVIPGNRVFYNPIMVLVILCFYFKIVLYFK